MKSLSPAIGFPFFLILLVVVCGCVVTLLRVPAQRLRLPLTILVIPATVLAVCLPFSPYGPQKMWMEAVLQGICLIPLASCPFLGFLLEMPAETGITIRTLALSPGKALRYLWLPLLMRPLCIATLLTVPAVIVAAIVLSASIETQI
ncbi:MAG: hypothetical protein GX413_11380 [Acetobacter sp.]|nr:hypothetical protein [Acetobacter sp.]